MATKDNSLLEIAVELLKKKKKPQNINVIIKEVMSLKGYKVAQAKELAPQFALDFMLSGYFVFCGDDCWDLKERQPISVLDKDGRDYDDIYGDDEDVKKNELKDDPDLIYAQADEFIEKIVEEDDDSSDEDENEDTDDLTSEFESLVESVDEEDDDEDEDENEE